MISIKHSSFCLMILLPLPSFGIVFDLNVTTPDIVTNFITVTYDHTEGQLTATGVPNNLKLANDDDNRIFAGFTGFSLTVNIDNTGALYAGNDGAYGTVQIEGVLDTNDNDYPDEASAVLLTGSISTFDGGQYIKPDGITVGNSSIFEFLFDVTGGTLENDYITAPDYAVNGAGIILSNTGFLGDWSADWTNGSQTAAADTSVVSKITSPVPEPASVAVISGCIAALTACQRRRK